MLRQRPAEAVRQNHYRYLVAAGRFSVPEEIPQEALDCVFAQAPVLARNNSRGWEAPWEGLREPEIGRLRSVCRPRPKPVASQPMDCHDSGRVIDMFAKTVSSEIRVRHTQSWALFGRPLPLAGRTEREFGHHQPTAHAVPPLYIPWCEVVSSVKDLSSVKRL